MEKEKSSVEERTNLTIKKSGIYLIKGVHWFYKLNYKIALVNIVENRVYLHSTHKGFLLHTMNDVKFIGPFWEKKDLINIREKLISQKEALINIGEKLISQKEA